MPLPLRDPGGPSHLPHLRIGCTVPRITLVKSGKAEAYPTVEIDLADAQVLNFGDRGKIQEAMVQIDIREEGIVICIYG